MATFKNISGAARDIPVLGLHVDADSTVEIPDEVAYSFENDPAVWAPSRVKNADVTVDPVTAAAFAAPDDGAVPPLPAPSAPAVPADPTN